MLRVRAIMGPTQFSLKARVVMGAAASIYKCYPIGLRGFPTRQMIRCGKRASSPAKIDDSMADDRQHYLYQDKTLTVVYQSKLSYYWARKKSTGNIIKSRYGSPHIWQAAMHVRGEAGLGVCGMEGGAEREWEAKQEEKIKHLGQSFLAVHWQLQCFFVISICFSVPRAREQ